MPTRGEIIRKRTPGWWASCIAVREVLNRAGLSEGTNYVIADTDGLSSYSALYFAERRLLSPEVLANLARSIEHLSWGFVVHDSLPESADVHAVFEVSGGGLSLIATDAWGSETIHSAYALLGFEKP